ncbi:MAG: hypothetical protein ACK5NA_11375 [Enterococcus sp.]
MQSSEACIYSIKNTSTKKHWISLAQHSNVWNQVHSNVSKTFTLIIQT